MSLMDELLLDPYPLDVWIAARTDGVVGSGSEDDPYDGSTKATPVISVTQIIGAGTTTASVTTGANHGFSTGDLCSAKRRLCRDGEGHLVLVSSRSRPFGRRGCCDQPGDSTD